MTSQRNAIWGLVAFVSAFSFSFAASGAPTFSREWRVNVWRIPGFVDQEITGLVQTDDGFIWAATRESLWRFDGDGFVGIKPSAVGIKETGRLRTMQLARDGSLWLGDNAGLVHRISSTGTQAFSTGLPRALTEKIVEDGEGAMWVTYRNGAVARIAGGKVTVLEGSADGSNAYCALARDNQGRIWYARRGDVGLLQNGRFEPLHRPRGASRIASSGAGGLWIVGGRTLYRLDAGGRLTEVAHPPIVTATAMLEDRSGALWIGSVDVGLYRFFQGEMTQIPTSVPEVASLLEGHEGSIWVGTRGAGLNQIRPQVITVEGSVAGLPAEAVRSLCEERSGRLWAVTQEGSIVRRAEEGWEPAPGALRSVASALSLEADPDAGIWIGTRAMQIHHWSDDRLRTLSADDGVRSRRINVLSMSREGKLWIGGSYPDSVQYLFDRRLVDVPLPRPNLNVVAIAEDAQGTLWFGTAEGVMLKYDGQKLQEETSFGRDLRGQMTAVHSMQATPEGQVWVAQHGGGLGWIRDGQYTRFTTAQGLADDGVSLVIGDRQGRLWIGSAKGVFTVRREDLEAVAAGRLPKVQPIRHGAEAGLPSLMIHSKGSGHGVRTRDDRIWLPMGNSLVIADPAAVDPDLPNAPVVVTELRIDGRVHAAHYGPLPQHPDVPALDPERSRAKHLQLGPVERKIEFSYASLGFVSPENVRYRHRLVGFDNDWSETGSQRTAIYPRIPGGEYRFEVEGGSGAGEWSGRGASVAMVIAPLFWETRPFQAGVMGLFGTLVFWIGRTVSHRRLRRKLKASQEEASLARERTRIARDIHDDIGNRLTRIVLLTGLAQRDRTLPEKAMDHVRQISVSAVEMTDALDEIVWAVNPRNDTLPHLLSYVSKAVVELLQTAGIRCHLDVPISVPDSEVDAEVRHNFFLVTKEAVTNIVRHANATEVRFAVAIEENWLSVQVKDNGRGMSAEPELTSNGLRNMRSRMTEIGGEFQIHTGPGEGVHLAFHFPLKSRQG